MGVMIPIEEDGKVRENTQQNNETVSTTTPTSSSPYEQFKGDSGYAAIDYLNNLIAASQEESEADKAKREKREKKIGFLARIADGLGALHKAYSHAAGQQAIDFSSLSARHKENIEKNKAQRDAERDRKLNYILQLDKMKDADRNFRFGVARAEQAQQNWQREYDDKRADRADDYNLRKEQVDNTRTNNENRLAETQRQFNIRQGEVVRSNMSNEALRSQAITETVRHNKSMEDKGNYIEFYAGDGLIKVPKSRMNDSNIAYIFNHTPQKGRPRAERDPMTGKTSPVTTAQMMQYIGANANDPNVKRALQHVSGVSVNNTTPPSRRSNSNKSNNNVPPSRRK